MRLIDADALIDKLQQHHDFYVMAWGGFGKMPIGEKKRVDEITNCIAEVVNAPTIDALSEWIPCSERLPSEKGMYLVTSREKATAEEFGFDLDDVEVKKMRFDEDGWRIPKHIPEWINGVVHTTVLAWMPLPQPYGEREGE